MNKKILLASITAGMLLATASFNHSFTPSFGDDTINFDVDVIQALSHKDGETVNFVNDYIRQYWDSQADDYENLKTLYEMNSDIESFPAHTYDKAYVRDLYANWDDFKPVNNTLSWKSNVRADSYDVVVSFNPEFTETVYEAKDLEDCKYTLVNPYSNSHYFWQVTAHTDDGDVKSAIFDFYSANYKRTIDIPTVSNTRDIGGFTGEYGKMVEGLIYRSGRLDDSTSVGEEALKALGIQTDLDIRAKGEGLKNPAKLPNYYLKTLKGYTADFLEENRPAAIEAFRIFANPSNYPIIFHCAVGRDRTGTMGMVLQALCGASEEYIIHDYYTSMWSVTGAYNKSLDSLNLNAAVRPTLNAITNNGQYSLSKGAENYLRVREDTLTHEMVGLTDEEIQSIRDIWSGKTPVEHAPKTFKAESNYEGKALLKVECVGHKDICMMVKKGTAVSAPYELPTDYSWFEDGEAFDFSTPIQDTTFVYADYVVQYLVYIHFVGLSRPDESIRANSGEVITFDKYETDGYFMLVLSDEGKEISKFNVTRDAYINIIFTKK